MTRSQVLFKAIDYLFHVPQTIRDFNEHEKIIPINKGDAYFDKRSPKRQISRYTEYHGGASKSTEKHKPYLPTRAGLIYHRWPLLLFLPNDCMKALNYLANGEYNLTLIVVVTGDSAGYFAAYRWPLQ